MLTSARFHDMCCFTCTYAYVRACVTSENKAFMLVSMPGLRFSRLELLVALVLLLVWLVNPAFYASLRIMLAPFSVYGKKKNDCKYNY